MISEMKSSRCGASGNGAVNTGGNRQTYHRQLENTRAGEQDS